MQSIRQNKGQILAKQSMLALGAYVEGLQLGLVAKTGTSLPIHAEELHRHCAYMYVAL